MSGNPFVGSWTYRSLLSDSDLATDFETREFGGGRLLRRASVLSGDNR
jgi:hypothetical protein